MDFGKYIHELLLDNEVVIVPGFGAFVSEYKPAEISDNSDEMKPPSKTVSFNQQIRNNDGLLVGLVAEKKRISHFDALKRIEKEREDILYKLDNGEQVEVDEVGVLYYTEENNIAFKAEADENLLLDSFGLESTTIVIEEEADEEAPQIVPPIITEGTNEKVSEEIDPDLEPVEEKPIVEEDAEQLHDEEPSAETLMSPIEKAEPVDAEEKKKRGWLWLLLILIPLAGVSIFIFMKDDNSKGLIEEKEANAEIQTVEEPTTAITDTLKTDSVLLVTEDSTVVSEPDSMLVKPANDVQTVSDTPRYYLVGGSFSVKENAETYLNELKAKGFDAFHVGKKGRFFIIGIASYDSFGQAEKAKKEYMDNNPGSEVWVYKK